MTFWMDVNSAVVQSLSSYTYKICTWSYLRSIISTRNLTLTLPDIELWPWRDSNHETRDLFVPAQVRTDYANAEPIRFFLTAIKSTFTLNSVDYKIFLISCFLREGNPVVNYSYLYSTSMLDMCNSVNNARERRFLLEIIIIWDFDKYKVTQ